MKMSPLAHSMYLLVVLLACAPWTGQSGSSGVKELQKEAAEVQEVQEGLKPVRYILYDVNPGEGFNLRRDVYMRMAVFVKKLNQEFPSTYWVLVLPPWGHLYHWQSRQLGHQVWRT